MTRSLFGFALVALVLIGGYAVFAGDHCGKSSAPVASSASGARQAAQPAASCEAPAGKIAGRFDPAMAGCRYSCATKVAHRAKDVRPQPGAMAGKLTQCPVSGVVFAVAADRPRVRVAGADYVTCCSQCAAKLERNPKRYLKS